MMRKLVSFALLILIHASFLPLGVSKLHSTTIRNTFINGAPIVNYNVLLGFEEDVSSDAAEIFYKYFLTKLSKCAQTDKTLTFNVFIIEKPRMSFESMSEVIQAVKDLKPIFIGGGKLNVEFKTILEGENITYYDIFTMPTDFSFSAINYVLQRTFTKVANTSMDVFIIHSESSQFPKSFIRKLLSIFDGNVEVFSLTSDENSILQAAIQISSTNVQNILVFASADESLKIAINARNFAFFNWNFRWMFFNSRIAFNSGLNFQVTSTNVTFVEIGKNVVIAKKKLYSESSTKIYDIMEIVYNLLEYYTACNTTQIVDDQLGLDTTGKLLINSDMTISRVQWQFIYYVQINPSLQNGYFVSNPERGSFLAFPPNLETENKVLSNLKSRVIQILALLEPPYVQFVPNAAGFNSTKDKLQGYSIDLLYYIWNSHDINFNLTLVTPGDKKWDDIWNDMFENLKNGKYDMIANIYQKPQTSDVDWSMPINKKPASILYRKNLQATFIEAFSFILPFDGWLWLAIFGSVIFFSILLTLINYLNPNKQNFPLNESFFFSLGSILQNLSTPPPNKTSARIIVVTFWIFCLAICVYFFCNYGVIIISDIVNTDDITEFKSLLNHPTFIFGTVMNSVYQDYLKDNSVSSLSNMYDVIQTYPERLVNNPQDGIDRVNQGNYAFIYYSPINLYTAGKYCGLVETMEFGSFEEKFIIRKNAAWLDLFNQWLAEAVSNNVVSKNYAKYFVTKPYVACNESVILANLNQYIDFFQYLSFIPKSKIFPQQNFSNMIGIFIIMIFGAVIVVVISLLERVVQNCYNKRRRNQRANQKHKLKKVAKESRNPYESYA